MLWIKERSGALIDPTMLDVAREWGSVRDILVFLGARGQRDG